MRIDRGLVIGLAALAAMAARADAQLSRLDGRVDGRTRAALAAIIDSTVDAGLSRALVTERLVSRALQGASSGASDGTIIAAVRDHALRLRMAAGALGAAMPAEVDAGAAALQVGVTQTTLAALRRARPRESVAVALVVLADLVMRGVPADTASGLILALADLHAGDVVYHDLRENVVRDINNGEPPVVAASLRTRGVLAAGAAAQAAAGADRSTIPTVQGGGGSPRPPGGPPPPP